MDAGATLVDRGADAVVIDLRTGASHHLAVPDGERTLSLAEDGRTLFVVRASGVAEAWDVATSAKRLALSGRVVGSYPRFSVLDANRLASIVVTGEDKEHRYSYASSLWSNVDGGYLAPGPPEPGVSFAHGDRWMVKGGSGVQIWDTRVESRSPEAVEALVRERLPWTLQDGRVVAR